MTFDHSIQAPHLRDDPRAVAGDDAGRPHPFVAVRDLFHRFGRTTILDGVSLDLYQGEFFTLLGPSGCGKTTLLRLIAGFDDVVAGRITLDGRDLAVLPAARRPINTVFQSYALFPHLNVADNVGFGLRMLGRDKGEIRSRVAEMLDLVRLAGFGERRIGQLSGGQQQRVALARALAPAPRLLLLDEPLAALDHSLRRDMQAELKSIQQSLGMTFLFVTHDREEAFSMSDRIAVMRAGKVVQCDRPRAIYDRPVDPFVAAFLGEANFLTGRLRTVEHKRAGIEIDGQTVHVPLAHKVAGAGPVTLMIRPEHVRIGAGAGLQRFARLERRTFLGIDHSLHFRLAGGEPVKVRIRNDDAAAGLEPGASATITFPAEHLRLLGSA